MRSRVRISGPGNHVQAGSLDPATLASIGLRRVCCVPVYPLTVSRRFGRTSRKDAWWLQPVAVFLGLAGFIVYSTWAAFQGTHYEFGPYLSPFYSPLLFGAGPHAWFGPKPGW